MKTPDEIAREIVSWLPSDQRTKVFRDIAAAITAERANADLYKTMWQEAHNDLTAERQRAENAEAEVRILTKSLLNERQRAEKAERDWQDQENEIAFQKKRADEAAESRDDWHRRACEDREALRTARADALREALNAVRTAWSKTPERAIQDLIDKEAP